MDNLVLSTFSLCVICVVFHQYVANPLWANEETTTESKISPVEEFLNDQTEKPRHDGEITLKTSDAPKVYPGDYLFQVSVGVKFVGANFKESEGIERRVARSIKRLVREKLSTFSSFKELFLLTIKRINAPGLLFVYWLYFSPGGEDIYIPLESRINQLLFKSVSNLRHGKAVTFSVSVEDVDECISGLSMCDLEANCLNAFGYYSCQCTKGFEDPSSTASSTGCVKNVKPETERFSSPITSALKNCHMTIEGDSSKCLSPAYPCVYDEYLCNWTATISVTTNIEADGKPHTGQPINLLSGEATEPISQDYERRWSGTNLQEFAQPTTERGSIWKSTKESNYFLVSNHGVQVSAKHHTSDFENVHLCNYLCTQPSRRNSKGLPSTLFEFSSVLTPSVFHAGFPGSAPSEGMMYRGNSVEFNRLEGILTDLLESFDSTERWMAMESKLVVSDDWASTSWNVVENLECEHLGHKRTLPLKTLQTFTNMQSKTEHHELWEPTSLLATANSGMRESEMVYSVSLDRMVSSLLTASFHTHIWTKAKSQDLYVYKGGLQTSIYQTYERTVQLIAPTHVYTSLKINSSTVTGNESWNYELEWLKTQIVSSGTFIEPVWQDTEATEKETDRTSFLNVQYANNPSISQTLSWMTLVPKLQDKDTENIGHLLEVSARVELSNVVYKNFQRLEKQVLQSVQNLIMNNLVSFYLPLKKILPTGAKRVNTSGFNFAYELYFGPNGENIQHSLQMHMNSLSNELVANMRNGQVHLVSISVRDVDECKSKTAACGKEANCLNTIGSYFCQCKYGFDNYSVGQKPKCIELDSGFWSSFGLKEILIASAICAFLLVSLALALCFVMFKRSRKNYLRTCDTYPAGVSGRNLSSEELESEESLFIVRHRSANYISFRKFQPIPEEVNGQETDSEEMINLPARKTWPVVKLLPS
ncbi:uncharacterized protein zgc:66455 isoform X2 [Pristis pectinata]|uniref:uncharacterized protein zgc:66455 isoform X2 n=1 Tax=Pristis pectinata TaxID=685728 RepID=UPI00223DE7B1|nr:uncharacterized protein zgc:66455 isoform X2 [Pristis pectinata]